MEKILVFKFAGIDFKVDADVNSEGELEGIFKVQFWHDKKKQYFDLYCDLSKFEHDMQDQLQEALEDYNLQKRLFIEDLAYETAREEGRL
jgi:hypothetical protein